MAVVVVTDGGMTRSTIPDAKYWRVEGGNLILLDEHAIPVAEFNYWDSVHKEQANG